MRCRIEQLFSKHDSKTSDSQDVLLRKTILVTEDRSRHNKAARLDGGTMRKLEANDDGIVGKERVVHSSEDLIKLDQTQLQCAELCKQLMADCYLSAVTYGGTNPGLSHPLPPPPFAELMCLQAVQTI